MYRGGRWNVAPLLVALLIAISRGPSVARAAEIDTLAAGFEAPPRSARPLVWWHWMNGYVTKEGITADLEAIEGIGLAGAQMFTVAQTMHDPEGQPVQGPIAFMSPQWRELVRHALDEGERLGLEMSIMNCEGWGQAGGHSVTPAQGMQKLVWTETQITGGQNITLDLPQPAAPIGYYQDIALVAFPTSPGDEQTSPPLVTCSRSELKPFKFATDRTKRLELPLPMPDAPQWVQLDFAEPMLFRSIRIDIEKMRDTGDPEQWEGSALLDAETRQFLRTFTGPKRWELQTSNDGQTWNTLAPIFTHGTTSLPDVRSRHFRIWMPVPPPLAEELPLKRNQNITITNIALAGARINRPEARTGQSVSAAVREFSPNLPNDAEIPSSDQVVDLTGKSKWDAPPGRWTVQRIGHAATGAHIAAGTVGGLEADKLSATAVREHLTRGMLLTVLHDAGSHVGATLQTVLCDSWESGYENWTPRMREEFQQRRGYAIDPWLPVLTGQVITSTDQSERFLWDFRRTIADLVAENYYGTLRDFAHEHKLLVAAEATGHGLPAVVDQLECKGRTDVPMGEFWVSRRDTDDTKEAASAAHGYGKPIVAAESFTSTPDVASWTRDLAALKSEGDLQFCMGVNRFCLHRFAHQPWLDRVPGMTMGHWGANFDRTNTWWEGARDWVTYLARCQYLLQQGTFVADLCYFYGEEAPVGLRISELTPPPPTGYDFDVCSAELLQQFEVESGLRVLVLPTRERMTPAVLRKIRELVRSGATIIGPRPTKSPSLANYPACDAEVEKLAAEIWGEPHNDTKPAHKLGVGRVLGADELSEALGVPPDFTTTAADLKFIHRRVGPTDIYFLSNQSEQPVVAQCSFRVTGRAPEVWRPDSGQREFPAQYTSAASQSTLPISLAAGDSLFVIFRSPSQADPLDSIQRAGKAVLAMPTIVADRYQVTVSQSGAYRFTTTNGRERTVIVDELPATVELTGPWALRFPPQRGAPAMATLPELVSWTESPQTGIKYFSGTATYEIEFDFPSTAISTGRRFTLDLGAVKNLAEVTLNEVKLGGLWKPPFHIEVTPAIKPGRNQLAIRVTNLWPNRMIGDLHVSPAERVTWTTFNPYQPDSPLLESGLLGPVRLVSSQVIELPRGKQ